MLHSIHRMFCEEVHALENPDDMRNIQPFSRMILPFESPCHHTQQTSRLPSTSIFTKNIAIVVRKGKHTKRKSSLPLLNLRFEQRRGEGSPGGLGLAEISTQGMTLQEFVLNRKHPINRHSTARFLYMSFHTLKNVSVLIFVKICIK